MKKIFLSLLFFTAAHFSFAQWTYDSATDGNRAAVLAARQQEPRAFQDENPWFFGGGIVAGFGTGGSAFGISPMAGYRLNNYVDAGLGVNLIYNSSRPRYWDGSATGEKYRTFNVGLVPFVRAFPVNNIFAQLQFEQAWVNGSYAYQGEKQKYNYDYQSLIASLGYAQRAGGRVGFFVYVGIDLLNHRNSPYRDEHGKVKPVFGTGINF